MIGVFRFPPARHFRDRMAEWGVSFMLVFWTVTLAQPDETMLQPQFVVLHRLASETFWTWVCGLVASARILALWANGSWHPSPFIRAATGFMSGLFWLAVTLGIAASGRTATGLGVYAVVVVFDLVSVYYATKDARAVWNLRAGSVSNAQPLSP